MPIVSDSSWSQVSMASMIIDISISRWDVVVSFFVGVGLVKFFSSLGVMSVPAKCTAWVRYGSVRIFFIEISRACSLKALSVDGAFISGGRWSCWTGSSSRLGGPVVAVHISIRKLSVVVLNPCSGSA